MDFFSEDLPSTSQSTPMKGSEVSGMVIEREDTDCDSSRGKSSSVSVTEIQEQRSSSSTGDIGGRVQELVERINQSHTDNQKMIDSFQEKFIEKGTELCQQMKEHMHKVYEENSNKMQVTLQELLEVLESCSKLIHELLEATRTLKCLSDGQPIIQETDP